MKSKALRGALALVVIVWLLAPAVAIWLLEDGLHRTRVEAREEAVWVPVEGDTVPVSRAVQINLHWVTGTKILSPAWTGTVQSVLRQPGEEVRSGDVLLVIDGVGRMALHTPTPFFGNLKLGDHGDEVEKLNDVLRELGFGSPTGTEYNYVTVDAVRRLKRVLGDNQSDGRDLSASLFVYLPQASLTIESMTVQAGSLAPASGSELIVGRRELVSASLSVSSSSAGPQGVAADPYPGGSPSAASEGSQTARDPDPLSAAPDEDLYVLNQPMKLMDDRSLVELPALRTLPEVAAAKVNTLNATLQRRLSNASFRIPSSAIFADESGHACVRLRREGYEGAENVNIIYTDIGSSVVSGDFTEGDEVIIAPSIEERKCA
ncbi:hypothetical protein ACIQTZ_13225 [Paenarthrobacter sp. NPDC090520]|uniref:hypothetical protein n=1 Tax=Paenarthrobacter sp. NPDC090520 TaxID=3364382 RepID=UPI003818289E